LFDQQTGEEQARAGGGIAAKDLAGIQQGLSIQIRED
jgi:hypothetical protein